MFYPERAGLASGWKVESALTVEMTYPIG